MLQLRSYVRYGFQSLVALTSFSKTMVESFPMKSTEISVKILVKHCGVYLRVHPCRLLHKVTSERCQDSERESRNLQRTETEHGVKKCKNSDGPEKQVVSDDGYDYEVSDMSQKSQIETMESHATHTEKTESTAENRETDNNIQIALNIKLVLPRVKQKDKCLPSGGDTWKETLILNRAGKATRRYQNFLNIKGDKQPRCIDLQHDVADWEESCEQNTEVLVFLERFDDEAVRAAQKQELNNWRSNDVYQEVANAGQCALSVFLVITEKNPE